MAINYSTCTAQNNLESKVSAIHQLLSLRTIQSMRSDRLAMEVKESLGKSSLMVVIIRDNWHKITAHKYHFHQQEEYYFVGHKIRTSHQEA